ARPAGRARAPRPAGRRRGLRRGPGRRSGHRGRPRGRRPVDHRGDRRHRERRQGPRRRVPPGLPHRDRADRRQPLPRRGRPAAPQPHRDGVLAAARAAGHLQLERAPAHPRRHRGPRPRGRPPRRARAPGPGARADRAARGPARRRARLTPARGRPDGTRPAAGRDDRPPPGVRRTSRARTPCRLFGGCIRSTPGNGPRGGADGPRHRRGGSKGEPPMELTLGHWAYLVGMVVIIGTMAFRRNVVVPAVAATFAVTWAYTGNVVDGLESMFKASLVAAGELFNIFLIIALITAMLGAPERPGSDKRTVQPFRQLMTG